MKKYEVTVYCLVYNHAKYLHKTLEGFVNQETNFPYRVIIHDDASSDSSDIIIKEYAEKYPDIIFPIIQSENQYSANVPIVKKFIQPLIDSKYTAICEGDDYWSDSLKLQRQYDYMETHNECSLCVHNTRFMTEDGIPLNRVFNDCRNDRDYGTSEVIESGGGGLFHTSSFFYRTKIIDKMPDDFFINRVGDYPMAIWFSMNGTVHYIGKEMSLFRVASIGSYSSRKLNDENYRIKCEMDMIEGIDRLNRVSNYKYDNSFNKVLIRHKYRLLRMKKMFFSIIFNPNYWGLLFGDVKRKIVNRIIHK